MNLREQVEADLEVTLEGEWGLPVVLISPDGEKQESPVILSASDLSFLDSDSSINSVTTDFRYLRLTIGDTITVSGSASNDGTLTVATISQNKITVDEAITTEAAGSAITLVNDSLDLLGQIIYDTLSDSPETGAEIIVHKPVVTLRRTSLTRIPVDGENWYVEIPLNPSLTGTKYPFTMERPTEDGGSIGFIRLYLIQADQI